MKIHPNEPIGGYTYETDIMLDLGKPYGNYNNYCDVLKTNSSLWGGHVEADAFAHINNVTVYIYDGRNTCLGFGELQYVAIEKINEGAAARGIVRLYRRGNHYQYFDSV